MMKTTKRITSHSMNPRPSGFFSLACLGFHDGMREAKQSMKEDRGGPNKAHVFYRTSNPAPVNPKSETASICVYISVITHLCR